MHRFSSFAAARYFACTSGPYDDNRRPYRASHRPAVPNDTLADVTQCCSAERSVHKNLRISPPLRQAGLEYQSDVQRPHNRRKAHRAARAVLEFAVRSLAAEDRGHRAAFHRSDPLYLVLRFGFHTTPGTYQIPLLATLALGGLPLLYDLLRKLLKREFGSDLLGGISIVTSILLGEYLAGSIIVLMLAGGEALESYALRSASSALAALARRMPSIAHRKRDAELLDVALAEIEVGDILVIYPHEICPADAVVIEGHGVMDESYLTGEPFQIIKTRGSTVISGAINGESALTIRTTQRAADSRYAKIMGVMRESEATRPQLRRLGDQLGAVYTPVALTVALLAWLMSGESIRFLAVLVIATPCPLLLAIPIAIIGSISLCARRAIIVKTPVVLEQIAGCRTAIFDKTGTLTYGEPRLMEQLIASGFAQREVLTLVASLERYSKHPLARAILAAATEQGLQLPEATEVSEQPGQGLRGAVAGHQLQISSRGKLAAQEVAGTDQIPPVGGGLECVVAIDDRYAAALRFRDAPRAESRSFVTHLGPKHRFNRVMIVSGDRESEVRYLADQVDITEIHAQKSPEEKLAIVRKETGAAKTLYVGDGINDAPAMMAATVGMAIGQNSDVTAEAAGVVILDNSLKRVDEFMHISRRMRLIALQSAVGGMALSVSGMAFAATGHLSPVSGAIAQEVIDILAVLNALRAAFPPSVIHDL
jgi:heavy metal translocating P-type ATPase